MTNDLLQIGRRLKIFYYEGNSNNRLIEIRGFVDDQVVWRFLRNQEFCYGIDYPHYFEILAKGDYLSECSDQEWEAQADLPST